MSDLAFDTGVNKWLPIDDGSALSYQPAPDGTVARPYVAKFAEQISMLDFVPYTTANDVNMGTAQINDIVTFLSSPGRKVLYVPARKFIFRYGGVTGYCIAAVSPAPSGTSIIGEGPGASYIFAADNEQLGGIALGGDSSDFTISGLTVDCNKQHQLGDVGVSGIRFSHDVNGIQLNNLRVLNADGYGIGLQNDPGDPDSFRHVKMSNIHIENAGKDGIDVKNFAGNNDDFQLNNITVINFDHDITPDENAGIDVRGPCHMNNIYILQTLNQKDNSGIRMRSGETGDDGAKSTLSNFRVIQQTNYLANQPSAGDWLTVGVDIESNNVTISNGYVEACDQGISIGNPCNNTRVSSVVSYGCAQAFRSIAAIPASCLFENCTAVGSKVSDIAASVGTRFANCRFEGVPAPLGGGAAAPAYEIVSATVGATGPVGFLRNSADELGHYGGPEVWRFTSYNSLTAYPSATFTTLGTLMLPAGANSRPAISVRSVSTGNEQVLSFETSAGVVATMSMTSAGLFFRDAAANIVFSIGNSNSLGFFKAPVAKPTVTGAKGANAALTSLLAGLVSLGLITDTTTA